MDIEIKTSGRITDKQMGQYIQNRTKPHFLKIGAQKNVPINSLILSCDKVSERYLVYFLLDQAAWSGF